MSMAKDRSELDRELADLPPELRWREWMRRIEAVLGWLVDRKIAPHIPVFDKSGRSDGTWSRTDFEWDAEND